MAEPTPPPLYNDALHNIFLHLPPEPAHLAAASAVCPSWRLIVHDEEGFLRLFRAKHGRVPPLLGFFGNDHKSDELKFIRTTTSSMNISQPVAVHRCLRTTYVCDSSHGRVLLKKMYEDKLLVWDPLAGDEHSIPTPTFDKEFLGFGASLICDADDHSGRTDCHSAPFRVAFAYLVTYFTEPNRIVACVYSSETRTWGNFTSLSVNFSESTFQFDNKPSVVTDGNMVYWIVKDGGAIVEFNMEAQRLTIIDPDSYGPDFILMPMDDGQLGIVYMMDSCIDVLTREVGGTGTAATWDLRYDFYLDDFIPEGASSAEDTDDDDEELDWWRKDDEDVLRPYVIGFSEGKNAVFLETDVGVFMLDMVSMRRWKVSDESSLYPIYPYSSFYTAAGKALFGEAPTQIDGETTKTQGEEILAAAASGPDH